MEPSKLLILSISILIALLKLSFPANAELVVQEPVPGEYVVLDTDTNLMWLQDPHYIASSDYHSDIHINYEDAKNWVEHLEYAGYTDWQLPTSNQLDINCSNFINDSIGVEFNCSNGDLGHLYYIENISKSNPGPFTSLDGMGYWTLDEFYSKEWVFVVNFDFSDGYQALYLSNARLVPWAVRDNSILNVDIDIKPGNDFNTINLNSTGLTSVAIISSETFDALTINPYTVRLAGAKIKMVGQSRKYLSHAKDINGDGLIDLVCQVYTAQLMIEAGETIAVLEAETFDGTSIVGEDTVNVISD